MLGKALGGIDAALLQAVEANRKALEQFVSGGVSLNEKPLKEALANIEKMEDAFFGAVTKASQSAGPLQGPGRSALEAMKIEGQRDRRAGDADRRVGWSAQAQTALRHGRATSMRAAQVMLDGYAAMVSGVLIGMSEGLQAGTRRGASAGSSAGAQRRDPGTQAAGKEGRALIKRGSLPRDPGDDGGDPGFDRRVVPDRPAPFALGLARPLVGRVESHLAAQSRYRRGEVEIVDRRLVDQHGVAHRVHPGRDRPDDFLPVADVDVVVGDDDELGVHELAQEAPDAEHHPLGVPGIAAS